MAAAGLSQPHRALQLCGAASAELDALGVDVSGVRLRNELLDRHIGSARAELGLDAQSVWDEGRRTRVETAIERALASDTTS